MNVNMENIEMDLEEIYEAVHDRAEAEGAFSREEWNDIVDEVLEERRAKSLMHDDDDWAQIREALQARYEEAEEDVVEL